MVYYSTLAMVLSNVAPQMGHRGDDFLDLNWFSMRVAKNDVYPLALVDKVGAPFATIPTFVTFLGSYVFRNQVPSIMYDTNTWPFK